MYSKLWCLGVLEKLENSAARPNYFWDNLYVSLYRAGLNADSATIERKILEDLRFNQGRVLFKAWKKLIKSGGKEPDPKLAQRFAFVYKEIEYERHFASQERLLDFEKTT